MTARIQRGATLEIQINANESFQEVVRQYDLELKARGHDISDNGDWDDYTLRTGRCCSCGLTYRGYRHMGSSAATIYSDMPEDTQCEGRQFNLHAYIV